jgi:DnaJ-domain-containing protein 1
MADGGGIGKVIEQLEWMMKAARGFDKHAKTFTYQAPFEVWDDVVAALKRLQKFDAMEQQFAKARPGASVPDCIGWLQTERQRVSVNFDSPIERKLVLGMYDAIIAHLNELHGRRQFVDADAEAARRKAHEENIRKQQEFKAQNEAREKAQQQQQQEKIEEILRKMREAESFTAFKSFFNGFYGRAFYEGLHGRPFPPPRNGTKWWEVLGVTVTATKDEINKAYRKAAQQCHPDKPGGSTEKMSQLNAARDEALAGLRN